jgi:ribosomal protein L11 methyltransferase
MVWLQISIAVSGDKTELISEAFESAGALSVTMRDAADQALLEPALGEHPLWSANRISALFPVDTNSAEIEKGLRDALPGSRVQVEVERLEDRDWSTTWRDSFHAMRFGTRLWVVPSGEAAPEADAVVVHLDPGLAFGTGTHTTTALCLEWLDAHPPKGLDVVDYGCGSGILAIAAARLGARRVRAVDIDPQALHATRENARRNGIGPTLEVLPPEALDSRPAHLVLANILANPLIELAGTLAACVGPRGRIVLTGILADQAVDVMAAYRRWFDFREPVQREGWALLEGSRLGEA